MVSEENIRKVMHELFTEKEIKEYGEEELFNDLDECLYSFESACEYYIEDNPQVLDIEEFIDWDGVIQSYNFGLVIDDEDDEKKVYVDNVLMEEYFDMSI